MKIDTIEHPLASQRVRGEGTLDVGMVEGRTRIRRLYQHGAAKIRLPQANQGPLEAVLINTAGGMTGGDRLDWSFGIGAGAAAVFTTQACERIYRTVHGGAEIRTAVTVEPGGHLAWLPQETILFDRCALDRRLDVDLQGDATALIAEALIFGRRSMGETVTSARYRDTWRIRRNGRIVHAENMALSGDVAKSLARAAVANGAGAVASVLLVSPDAEARLEAVRGLIGDAGGASAWSVSSGQGGATGKLLARIIGEDGYQLRRRLVPVLELLNGRADLPKVWSL